MISVTKAKHEDLPQIASIAAESNINRLDSLEQGFLVSNFSLSDYEEAFGKGRQFWIAKTDDSIVGFAYGYESKDISLDDTENQLIKMNLVGEFFLIKQICAKRNDDKAKGAAKALYKKLKEQHHLPLVAAVVVDPINSRSIQFHEKLGFKQILRITPNADYDGVIRQRGVWRYMPPTTNCDDSIRTHPVCDPAFSDNIIDYHANAVALYSHEDNLNWTKFGLNVTFLLALIATVPYLTDVSAPNLVHKILSLIVVFLGFGINYLFAKKIKSGLHYMNHHKDRVKEIERKIYHQFGYGGIINTSDKDVRGESVTSNLMHHVPLIINIVWIATAILIVLKVFYSS